MLALYKNIKKLRQQLNLSQDDLAKKIGYTNRSSIAKIEKGEVDLPLSKIILIHHLNEDIYNLFQLVFQLFFHK